MSSSAIASRDAIARALHRPESTPALNSATRALNVRGIVSQRLVPRANGSGRVAAIEVMLNTPRIADLIGKGEIAALKDAIDANAQDGSRSFDRALYELHQRGEIALDEALRQADSANNLRIRIKMEGAGQTAGELPKFSLEHKEEVEESGLE